MSMPAAALRLRSDLPPTAGELPAWEVAELPTPAPFGLRNVLKVIGPGAVTGLLVCSAFYAFFAGFVIRDLIRSLLK